MKIAVGTTASSKLKYIGEVCNDLDCSHDIFPVEVLSGVSEQPLTSEETRQGSVIRAENAIALVKEAEIGMGIEVGYEKINDRFAILCWVSVVDKNGKISSWCSTPFSLPDYHHDILEKGLFLGDYVRAFAEQSDDLEHQKLAFDIVHRRPYIVDALTQAFSKYEI